MLTSRNQFATVARNINVSVAGTPFVGVVKEFSTGSLGWYVNGKAVVELKEHGRTPIVVNIAGTPMIATPKDFSTGSKGWFLTGKILVPVADGSMMRCQVSASPTIVGSKDGAPITPNTQVKVQVGISITVIGSKELPKEGDVTVAPPQVAAAQETQAVVTEVAPPTPKKPGKRAKKAANVAAATQS